MNYSPHSLLDIRFSDFTARHVFSAKLRLVILIGYWLLSIFLYPSLLTLDQPVMLIISGTFVVTTICYAFILKGIWPIFFFVIELAADVTAQTVLIYLTGGPSSTFFTVYIIYAAAGGLFYNYRVASVIAVLAEIFYGCLLIATFQHWLEPFFFPFGSPGGFDRFQAIRNFILLTVFLGVDIYGIWIASHFTKIREQALEQKNRELIALNRISSLTRSVITFEHVVHELVRSVREGMGYESSLILFHESGTDSIRVLVHEPSSFGEALKKLCEGQVEFRLEAHDETNQVYQAMKRKKLIIRNELFEIFKGVSPPIDPKSIEELQRRFGFKKFVAAPMVAEGNVVGALIGVSREEWISPEAVHAFEGFADQAALTLDNVLLIAELKKKNIELERVSRVKSEFLATMSHELRTPLTAIIGFSELLLEEVMGGANADQKESLREILVNGENLLHMINGLLDLAKIESGKMELSIAPVSLHELLERVQRMMASLVQKKSQKLEITIPSHFPVIHADERKMQQILLNLLSNAIKFTPEQGSIEIVVTYDEEKRALKVSVIDTGIGISKKDQQAIFEPFRQADSSYTREYQGTGLGLALVKQFVGMQGGSISVESDVGQGAKFTFIIPNTPKISI